MKQDKLYFIHFIEEGEKPNYTYFIASSKQDAISFVETKYPLSTIFRIKCLTAKENNRKQIEELIEKLQE